MKIREYQNRPCRRKQGEGKIRKAKRSEKRKIQHYFLRFSKMVDVQNPGWDPLPHHGSTSPFLSQP